MRESRLRAPSARAAGLWLITFVTFVEGAFTSLFNSAAAGALRSVVAALQPPAAVGAPAGAAGGDEPVRTAQAVTGVPLNSRR